MTETAPMPTCPMAETCKGMMQKPGSGFWLFIPGFIFIVLGIAILVFPQILVGLVALALIVMGFAMLVMVKFMRNIGKPY